MCQETLELYDKALNKVLSEGTPSSVKTIVDTLRAVVRLTKVLQRSKKKNDMGDKGEHVMTYIENLLFELDQLG